MLISKKILPTRCNAAAILHARDRHMSVWAEIAVHIGLYAVLVG